MTKTPLVGSFASAAASSNGPGTAATPSNAPGAGRAVVDSSEFLSILKKPSSSTASNASTNTNTVQSPPVIAPTATAAAAAIASTATSSITPPQLKPLGLTSTASSAASSSFETIPKAVGSDDLGLLGLVNSLKACPADRNIFGIGLDLEVALGLPLAQPEPLASSFGSPWFENDPEVSCNSHRVSSDPGKDVPPTWTGLPATAPIASTTGPLIAQRRPSALASLLPSCYYSQPAPSATSKLFAFADETLFYIFYAMPGDRMQELAARELSRRAWRFHKPSKTWISPVSASTGFECDSNPQQCFVFDQNAWIKLKRNITVKPGDLEEPTPSTSNSPSSLPSPSNTANVNISAPVTGSSSLQSHSVTH